MTDREPHGKLVSRSISPKREALHPAMRDRRAERLVDLNLRNAKIALEHGTFSATALASIKDSRGLIALQKELADAGIQGSGATAGVG
jgi:hypothetical protein